MSAGIELRVMPDKRLAPTLSVRFRCKCGLEAILDAYRGVPTHHGFMDPISLVLDRQPLADIEALRATSRGNFV